MNKFILTIIIVIVAFGAFTLFGNKKTAPATIAQPTIIPTVRETNSSIVTVVLTGSGFVPKDIIVKVGTKVIWENKSGTVATVNSDNHPNHLLYSFLNLGDFADGATLQVVFDKTGKYSYHNHLNPSETGTVTVE